MYVYYSVSALVFQFSSVSLNVVYFIFTHLYITHLFTHIGYYLYLLFIFIVIIIYIYYSHN